MLTLNGITKRYGDRFLFDKISLTIGRGEKVGLVGPNGAGKSTLFRLIMDQAEVTDGSISMTKNTRIGYLPQESSFASEHTVLKELTEGDSFVMGLIKEKEYLENSGGAGTTRYGDVVHRLEHLDYFNLEHKAKKILSGLGFKESDHHRPINELSGGWQMRTLLARLLTFDYDLLLLDEPTNYLDLDAAMWFKEYLAAFDGTFIMVSHDKSFLNEVTNYTLILENAHFAKASGGYDSFRKLQEERRDYLIRQFKEQQKRREDLQRFVDRFHAQPNKASQVRAKKKQLERLDEEAVVVPPDYRESIKTFKFPAAPSSGHKVISLAKMNKSYGSLKVYQDFDFEITRGEKAVLAGPNGAGKSTLLKILAGVLDIDSGKRAPGHNVDIGYFSQTRLDVLNPDNTVLEEAYSASGGALSSSGRAGALSTENLRTILGAFLFRGDDVEKKVKILSGGEKSRLILAKLLIDPPNFLLLDEPTTHLDVDAVDALVRALNDYDGTIVFISHDIHFVRSVANAVYEVNSGRVRKFPGQFDYYWERKNRGDLNEPKPMPAASQVKPVTAGSSRAADAVSAQDSQKMIKKLKKLRKVRQNLELDFYAKERIVNNPHHGEDVVKYYRGMIGEIRAKLDAVDRQMLDIKAQLGNDK